MTRYSINLNVIILRRYSYANRSRVMIINSKMSSHRGGSLTKVSKQMFMKDRKKNAVKSQNTTKQAIVWNID